MGTQLFYSSSAVQTTLSATLTSGATSIQIATNAGWPVQFPATMLLEWGTSNQEVVTLTQAATGTGPYTYANVLRGQDGTTALTHSSGSQVNHGVSARDFFQTSPVYNACAYGADPTGTAFSDTAMAATLTALGTGHGQIILPPGTYKFSNSYTFGPGQSLVCPAGSARACTIFYYGNSVLFHAYDPAFNISALYPPSPGGTFTGFTIDGTHAGSAAKGFQLGDLIAPTVNIQVQNFTGATAMGAWFANTVGWTEYGTVVISAINNTSNIVFDNSGGLATFDAMDFTLIVAANPNQNGITWQNATYQLNGIIKFYAAFLGATSSNTGVALNIGPDGSASGLLNVQFLGGGECDFGTGTVGHATIKRGTNAFMIGCTGQLLFKNASGTFQVSSGCGPGQYAFTFAGYLESQTTGDALGNPATNGIGFTVAGGTLWGSGVTDGGGTGKFIYNGSGDFFQTTLANGANTFSLFSLVPGKAQRLIWHVTQPPSGAAGTLTLTGAKTTAGSGVLTLSSVNSLTDAVQVWTPDGVIVYATVMGLNLH